MSTTESTHESTQESTHESTQGARGAAHLEEKGRAIDVAPVANALFDIGATWAAFGLDAGRRALQQSARTLETTARTLDTLAQAFSAQGAGARKTE